MFVRPPVGGEEGININMIRLRSAQSLHLKLCAGCGWALKWYNDPSSDYREHWPSHHHSQQHYNTNEDTNNLYQLCYNISHRNRMKYFFPVAVSVLCYTSWRRVLSVKALLMTKVISTPGEGYSHQGCLRKMKTCELTVPRHSTVASDEKEIGFNDL